jgi:hypothetical protein
MASSRRHAHHQEPTHTYIHDDRANADPDPSERIELPKGASSHARVRDDGRRIKEIKKRAGFEPRPGRSSPPPLHLSRSKTITNAPIPDPPSAPNLHLETPIVPAPLDPKYRPKEERRKERRYVQNELESADDMLEDHAEEQVLSDEGIESVKRLIPRDGNAEGPKCLSAFLEKERVKVCPDHQKPREKFCVCSPVKTAKEYIR